MQGDDPLPVYIKKAGTRLQKLYPDNIAKKELWQSCGLYAT